MGETIDIVSPFREPKPCSHDLTEDAWLNGVKPHTNDDDALVTKLDVLVPLSSRLHDLDARELQQFVLRLEEIAGPSRPVNDRLISETLTEAALLTGPKVEAILKDEELEARLADPSQINRRLVYAEATINLLIEKAIRPINKSES